MTYARVHKAIRTRFEGAWGNTTDVQYPNVPFTPSKDAWVRLSIADASAEWASFGDPGNNVERNVGQVTLQIFVPINEGEGRALELADNARTIFRSWSDTETGLRFLVPPYARQVGSDGTWYQINVIAPFVFDDFT